MGSPSHRAGCGAGPAAGSSPSLTPGLSRKLHQPKTQDSQTTGSHSTTLPVPKALRIWSFKGRNNTTNHPTQTKRRLRRSEHQGLPGDTNIALLEEVNK